MPSDEQKRSRETDEKTISQSGLSATAEPHAQSQKFWRTFLEKMAIAERLFGKELYGLRLNRLDLAKADRRLGEKAYATATADEEAELVSKLDGVTEHLTRWQQQEIQAATTFGGRLKAFAIKAAKTVQIAALQRKRRRMLRQLGVNLRQSAANSSLVEETQLARGVADRLRSVEMEIRQLTPQTYAWARRPLLVISLLLLVLGIGGAFIISNQYRAILAQQRGAAGRSSLSDAQMKSVLSQQQAFQQQLRDMVAEAHRKEAQETQSRIAAAERQYKEQRDRERAEVQKKARAQAQKDEEARREQAEREKQQAQIAAAEQARLEREEAEAEKLAREKAEREKAEAERAAAAERARKEEEQRAAQLAEEQRQQEEDQRAAQKIPASQLIAKSDLEAIMGFPLEAPEDREVNDKLSKRSLPGVEEFSSCFFASASPPKSKHSFKGVMLTVRYLRDPDSDHAETVVRNLMKADYQSVYDFDEVRHLQYGGFYLNSYRSIFVFKSTLRGSTLVQVGIEGAPSEESARDDNLWREHLFDRETKIALKILGPPRSRVASYQGRHPREREEIQSSYLPDIPGVDPKVRRFFDGFYQRAAAADVSRINNSKSVVAASGGTKMLCPKCHGSQLMVTHGHDYSVNPHGWGTLEHSLFENAREKTNFVSCDRCGGTGVVDAR